MNEKSREKTKKEKKEKNKKLRENIYKEKRGEFIDIGIEAIAGVYVKENLGFVFTENEEVLFESSG